MNLEKILKEGRIIVSDVELIRASLIECEEDFQRFLNQFEQLVRKMQELGVIILPKSVFKDLEDEEDGEDLPEPRNPFKNNLNLMDVI